MSAGIHWTIGMSVKTLNSAILYCFLLYQGWTEKELGKNLPRPVVHIVQQDSVQLTLVLPVTYVAVLWLEL